MTKTPNCKSQFSYKFQTSNAKADPLYYRYCLNFDAWFLKFAAKGLFE